MSNAMERISRPVGQWSLQKLTMLREYLAAYVRATQTLPGDKTYVDLFSGPGLARLRHTNETFDGSPLIGMRLYPGFTRFFFVDSDSRSVASLHGWVDELGLSNVARVAHGDANNEIGDIVKLIPTQGGCFVFHDPHAPVLNWTTVAKIASLRMGYYRRRPEQLILFPYEMGIARQLPRKRDPKDIWAGHVDEKLSQIFPHPNKWRQVYETRRQGLIGALEQRRRFYYLYWAGLKELGYAHVLGPRVITTEKNMSLYELFFVSDHSAGKTIMNDVFNKQRSMFDQQLRLIQKEPFVFQEGESWYLEAE